jgi:hypothetical protein
LPADLEAKPVCAFLLGADRGPRAVLAQLEAAGSPAKQRLILVAPDVLPKGTETAVHVYLGLPEASPRLPTAARTRPGDQGWHWMENDQVRLLLGPEGAHVYRWEVKAADNRDLTMPGESGWAGFCDLGTHRHSLYRLNCTALGPAMVEYECRDADDHLKILRLYGGASWLEVFLSEPTPIYWDFDDPKNFAADGPTPGTWLFSDGQSGLVGREADGVPAQVKAPGTFWGAKFSADKLMVGLLTPGTPALHVVAPGSGAGGVGIEGSPAARHFVTFAGRVPAAPGETMNRLQATLDLKHPVAIRLHALQPR